MAKTLRLVVAEDETTTRSALVALLELEDDLHVVEDVPDGVQAVRAVAQHAPDILLLDLEMPEMDGIEVCEKLANDDVKILVLTRYARPGALRRALQARADGFITKSTPVARVAEIIRDIHTGERYIDPQIAALTLTEEACPLSNREISVLRATLPGGTVSDIAAELNLAQGTVRNYLSLAMTKTGGRTRYEAAQIAQREGWL